MFKDGKAHGWGRVLIYFGRSTEGEYRNGCIIGDATQVSPEGIIYKGQVNKIEFRHGYGELSNKDGRKYRGQWKDGYMHGLGSYRHAAQAG
jgi:hypothetical protein